ncbi:hypothetical protein TNIN_93091 [Trichonephila inaurata madagascariensis]|uniref:Uncharacterized protein n=1 Tax=Trichonephila inaurata madagascariensis TaxID=2747483 RepID=A0A8X6YJ63_9ARAC|nr:hypothetical protein TNIN_93091 [Trichonephila inaurata madagascariensis]
MSHAHPLDPVEALVCRLKHQGREKAKVLENDHLTIRRGKTILFTCVVPIRGSMRGLKDGAVARKPVQHFLMSVVRLKTLFWELRRKTPASDHLHSQKQERL